MAGNDALTERHSMDDVKAMLVDVGYRGDPPVGSLLRGNGKDACIGWPDIQRIEKA